MISVSLLRPIARVLAVYVALVAASWLIPGFVPVWMRVQMLTWATLMAVTVLLVVRVALAGDRGDRRPASAPD